MGTKGQSSFEYKKPTRKETYNAPKDSRMPHHKDAALDSQSKSDIAKLEKICESLKSLGKNIPIQGFGKSQFIYEIALAFGHRKASLSNSNYEIVTILGIGKTTIPIANHSAETINLGKTPKNFGFVIKNSKHRFSNSTQID